MINVNPNTLDNDLYHLENTLEYFPIAREAIVAPLKEHWSLVEIAHYSLSCFIAFLAFKQNECHIGGHGSQHR